MKQKLELTWIGKENRPKLEPRILLEDPALSYHARFRVKSGPPISADSFETDNPQITQISADSNQINNLRESAKSADTFQANNMKSAEEIGDIFDNRLIFGDNLLALKALEAEFAGKGKCVFIDPPYNTGSAFTHYDDGLEHSIWLSLMRDRLEIIRRLLAEDGSLWITIDDNEAHYLKVVCDEVFGRGNFVANVVWQKKYSPRNNQKGISSDLDHVLVFSRNSQRWAWNLLPRSEKQDAAYKNPDNDPRGLWKASDLTRAEHRDRDYYQIVTPSGKAVLPAKGRSWSRPLDEIERLRKDNRLWFGPNGDAKPSLKRFLTEVQEGIVAKAIWNRDEVGDNEEAKKETKLLVSDDIFATPKPERLIKRVLRIATNPNDLVLDSFAGSGTTGAVAHKMGRRWILVELGEHCHTHIIPRLKKVIDGDDPGGITKAVNWRWRFPLLSARAVAHGNGQLGQLGDQ
ncbi:MAG: site-specific DNA-methyltransferase [Methylococcales bacterium]